MTRENWRLALCAGGVAIGAYFGAVAVIATTFALLTPRTELPEPRACITRQLVHLDGFSLVCNAPGAVQWNDDREQAEVCARLLDVVACPR